LLCTATPLWLSMFVSLLTFVLRSWRRAGAVLQRRVRGAVPAVAGGQREEGGEAPEDRPVMEGDRRSWYARGGSASSIPLHPHSPRAAAVFPSVSGPALLSSLLEICWWLGREQKEASIH
jgi:hypothetical protein